MRWLFNNEPVSSPHFRIGSRPDGTHTLHIAEVFDEDAGRFSVLAENDAGKATCSALLVVVDASQILPRDESPPETPMKRAAPPMVPVQQVPVHRAPPPPPPAPVYQPVDVTIELPVPPEFVDPLRDIAAQEGTRVTFEGCVRGRPEPTIRWFREGRPLTAGADFEISYRDGRVRLSIPEVFPEDAGRYLCSAENKGGRSQSSAELVVKGLYPTSPALSVLRATQPGKFYRVRNDRKLIGRGGPAGLDMGHFSGPEPEPTLSRYTQTRPGKLSHILTRDQTRPGSITI